MQVFFTPILTVGMSSKPIVGVANRVHYVFLCSLCVKQFSARWGVEVPPTFRSLLPLPKPTRNRVGFAISDNFFGLSLLHMPFLPICVIEKRNEMAPNWYMHWSDSFT